MWLNKALELLISFRRTFLRQKIDCTFDGNIGLKKRNRKIKSDYECQG